MNRDALDEWFAQADDILTDWRPGGDAMHATPPADDGEALPARADSYYDQPGRHDLEEFRRYLADANERWRAELDRNRLVAGRWHNLTDETHTL